MITPHPAGGAFAFLAVLAVLADFDFAPKPGYT